MPYPPNRKEGTMPAEVLIFGKDAWPYTRAARAAFAKEGRQVKYYNVVKETSHFDTMLQYSNGTRKVPVIVEGETVTIGFEGGTWGVWFFPAGSRVGKDKGRTTKDDGWVKSDELRVTNRWNG